MAEETVVKEALTDKMIEAGASLLNTLDKQHFIVDAALWLYLTEANRWRLLVATPEVRVEGPKKTYRRLLNALRNAAVHNVDPQNISVIDARDAFIELLRSAVRVNRNAGGVRFSRNTVNGQFIEDAYIYRTAA
jgi:hypothetical protein